MGAWLMRLLRLRGDDCLDGGAEEGPEPLDVVRAEAFTLQDEHHRAVRHAAMAAAAHGGDHLRDDAQIAQPRFDGGYAPGTGNSCHWLGLSYRWISTRG